jgi:hypothetical protein
MAVTPSDQRDCWNETRRPRPASAPRSAFVGFRFPPEIIAIAVAGICARACPTPTSKSSCSNAVLRSTTSPSTSGCCASRHGRAALSCMASHRAVRQQPRRGRSWPPGVTAATDARTRAGPVAPGSSCRPCVRAEPPPRSLRTDGRGAGRAAADGRVRPPHFGDLIPNWWPRLEYAVNRPDATAPSEGTGERSVQR